MINKCPLKHTLVTLSGKTSIDGIRKTVKSPYKYCFKCDDNRIYSDRSVKHKIILRIK